MAIVMLSEAQDYHEPKRVRSNGRSLSPIASCGRIVGSSPTMSWIVTREPGHTREGEGFSKGSVGGHSGPYANRGVELVQNLPLFLCSSSSFLASCFH